MGTPAPAPRLFHLDSLRGLAALTVVLSHYVIAFGHLDSWSAMWIRTPLHVWWDGAAAVSFFFVLSGLVLALGDFQRPDAEGSPWLFMLRRVVRIGLPYVGAVGLSALIRSSWDGSFLHAGGVDASAWVLNFWKAPLTLAGTFKQALLVHGYSWDWLIPQAWSLAVELELSMLIPVLVLVARRSTALVLFLGALLAYHLGVSEYLVHFAAGVALAKHWRTVTGWVAALPGFAKVSLGLASLVLYQADSIGVSSKMTALWGPRVGALGGLALVAGGGGFLVLAEAAPSLRALLQRPVFVWLGKVSFAVYLTHFVALLTVTPWALELGYRMGLISWLLRPFGALVTLAASLALAEVFGRLWERPVVRLGNQWVSRLASGRRLQAEVHAARGG